MSKYRFDCGCAFDIVDDTIKDNDGLPGIKIDYENIPEDCPATWQLIQSGHTKGVFQLETNLGRKWAKELAPTNITEMSALVSLMRPGCLRALVDGKSMTQHYCDRKNAGDEVKYFHDALEPILQETYGVLCIHEDTFVSMDDGRELPIKQVVAGDLVKSVMQTDFSTTTDLCVDIVKSPKTSGVELLLENGYRIKLTTDHKVLTQRGEVKVCDLTDDDVIQVVVKQDNNKTNSQFPLYDTNTRFSYLIGQLVGDGCSGSAICSGEKKSHDILYKHLQNEYPELNFVEYYHCRSWYIGVSGSELLNSSKHGNRKTKYRLFVEQLGLDKTKHNKQIPLEIFQTSDKNRRAFLAGLFDSDGYAGQHKNGTAIIHFCSDNPAIINGIRKLLSLDGIETYISNNYKHIHINNTAKFDELISPFLIVKKVVGQTTTAKTYGSFPRKLLRERITSLGFSVRNFCDNSNIARSSISKRGLCNIATAKKAGYDFGDISMMKIKKITPIKDQVFYSISIENTHNLIGNGIVISNCYQEQSMRIAQDLAGASLQEADILRKAIGKKKADIMAKVKPEFIQGCVDTGLVTEEEAEEIFGWIQESQRYSFNKSHGVSYGLMGYWSAYVKAHFPYHFYTSWLYYSHEKMDPQEEMQLLISDARYFDIEIRPPSLNNIFRGDIGHFALYDNCVYFGIGDIKRIGDALVSKVTENVRQIEEKLGRTIDKWTWSDFLLHFSDNVTTTAVNGMIASGATDFMHGSRVQKIHEYETWKKLTQKERDWIRDNYNGDNLIEGIQLMLHNKPRTTKPRIDKVTDVLYHAKNPPFSLEDTAYYIAQKETELLGVPITRTKLDTCDMNREPDTTCKEFLHGKSGKMSIAVEITEAKEYIISKGKMKGQKMMFLSAEDQTASLDSITIFPRTLEGNEPLLIKGGTVLLTGQRDRQRSESFIVDSIIQI